MISALSVATTTGPTAAAVARSSTCTIIGLPQRSASGFPGSRIEASRAGMRTRTSPAAIGFRVAPAQHALVSITPLKLDPRPLRGAYTGCQRRGNRLSVRPHSRRARHAKSASPMDSFEVNKILGAVLFTCLVLLALNITAGALFTPEPPKKPGYEIAVQEEPAGAPAAAPAAEQPIEQALASADPKRGQQTAKVCQTCHTFEKGGPNKIGPNLWGVLGRKKGTEGGFAYSDAIKSKGGEWTVDDLNKFLANPRAYAPGTKMNFAGLQRENQRADAIAYLNTLSDNPKPLPTAAAPSRQEKAQPQAAGETPARGQSAPGAKPSPPPGQAQTQSPTPAQPQTTSPGQ